MYAPLPTSSSTINKGAIKSKSICVKYTEEVSLRCKKTRAFGEQIAKCLGNIIGTSVVNKVNTNHIAITFSDLSVYMNEVLSVASQSAKSEHKSIRRTDSD